MKTLVILQAVLLVSSAWTSVADLVKWEENLYLGRGSFWQKRIPISVSNHLDEPCEGAPATLKAGTDLPLSGVRVEELRLVDENGTPLLFGVWGDERIESGPIPQDAEISIPVSLPAKGSATYWLYWDNPCAWGYADFFKAREVLDTNGGFEKGSDKIVAGWQRLAEDAHHRLAVDTQTKLSGTRALRAETDPDASESWFSFSRHDITVKPGNEVTIRVKVRAQNVNGYAGWYVHIGNKTKGDVVNHVQHSGGGTYGWKETVIREKVPDGCTRLSTGSVLRGTGTAWYDDFTIDLGVMPRGVTAQAGKVEVLKTKQLGEDAAWLPGTWESRVPVRIANFSDTPIDSVLASVNLKEALRCLFDAEFRLHNGSDEVPLCVLGDRAFFTASIPAGTVRTYWLYLRPDRTPKQKPEKPEEVRSALGSIIPSDQVLITRTRLSDKDAYAKLQGGSLNLLVNPSFENGMTGWTHTKEKKDSPISYEIVKTGGFLGGSFAKMAIPESAPATWRGWYQTVAIKPGRHYFYGGFLSTEAADKRSTIHLHKFNRKGENTLMTSASESVDGTSPWTPMFGTLAAGSDDVKISLHLTTDGHGTFAHDGLIFAEYRFAQVGDAQSRPHSPSPNASALAVQSVLPIRKVFRETPVADGRDFKVFLAKNETEALQLAVRSPRNIDRLEVEVTPPRDASGSGDIAVETGWVEFVPVDYATSYYSSLKPEWILKYPTSSPSSDGWSGWWPDPIAPVNSGRISANQTQPVWVNFRTTASTKPGTYTGAIRWKADGTVLREDKYTVRVWNFSLPAIAETPAIYDIRLSSKWWSEDFRGMDADTRRRTIWKFYSAKRICPDTLGGQVKFSRKADGGVEADFTEYDRLATEYFDEFRFPVSYMAMNFYCFGWAMPPKQFLGEQPFEGDWPFEGADPSKLRAEYKRVFQEALRLYWNHVKEKGWSKKLVLYISDEPHFWRNNIKTQMIALCQMIHEVDPEIPIYSSTWQYCPEWNGSIDVWGAGHYGNFPVAEMKAQAAAGKHIWFTTDGQMCLDTPFCAVERMLPHYCVAHHADAYEFWGATWLTYDPWKFGWHAYIPQSDTPGKNYFVRYPDGDGYLIYPGVPGRFKGPVTSIRLEAARDGVEDFSYLKRLERLAAVPNGKHAAAAQELLSKFRALVSIPNAGGRHSTRILPEPEIIGTLRHEAGELLNSVGE